MRGTTDMNTLHSLLQYQFIQYAILAAIFASIISGIVGVIVVEKKMVMMTGGLAHVAFAGVGLGFFLSLPPIYGAFLLSLLFSWIMMMINKVSSIQLDLLMGIFWSSGMALGVFFIALTPGYPPHLASYLFGNILAISRSDLNLMMVIALFILFIVVSCFPYWKAFLFDQEFARIKGIKTVWMEFMLFTLIAMAVVALIKVTGIILSLALLTIPTAISAKGSPSLGGRMIWSAGIGMILCWGGLILSFLWNIPSGATIVLLSSGVFALVYTVKNGASSCSR
jgi:zinc transport system permease protein